MKLRLLYPGRVPYGGGYDINKPELGMVAYGTTFEQLEARIRIYRKANGIPTGLDFSNELQALVCQLYPQECDWFDPNIPETKVLTMDQVVRGTRVLFGLVKEWAKYLIGVAEHPLVDQETANTRASKCASCKYNVPFRRPCSGLCGELLTLVNLIKGGRKTPHDGDMKSCSICGCVTEAHVWPRLDLLAKGVTEEQKNQFRMVPWCWKQVDSQPGL